jgi:murein DD-endopeptidase MepM/ murein hydrolase activator NlpD
VRTAVVLASLALLLGPAAAEEMSAPVLSVAQVDWTQAAADSGGGTPASTLAPLNAAASVRFSGLGASGVPVLLPFDIAGWRKEVAANPALTLPPDAADRFVQGGFQPTHFFDAGPAGYDAAFSIRTDQVKELSDIDYVEPVYVLLSGFRFTYELNGPRLPEATPVKDLDGQFPGIQRTMHEYYLRTSFARYGVTYVVAIFCRDVHPRARVLSCSQAARIADRFIKTLQLVGGAPDAAPLDVPAPPPRPQRVDAAFSYYPPGSLIPYTGLKADVAGSDDSTVYARLRFPMKEAPAFANSQSFNSWGDCDFTGRVPHRVRAKDAPYECKVNGRPLVFDEAGGGNYRYPWRDNFCEHRHFPVGQCPGGEGHQGQDIRPSFCKKLNDGADRCEPYQQDIVAVHDGVVLRARKQEAVFLFINSPRAHIRVRYIHMNPKQLDADGMLSGKQLSEGDTIGKVGNYNDYERGTTYHLHFDMQVPTRIGYVFVNPYMTLVSAYERLIGGRGTEIEPKPLLPPPAKVTETKPTDSNAAAKSKVERHPLAVRLPPHRPRHRVHRRRIAHR